MDGKNGIISNFIKCSAYNNVCENCCLKSLQGQSIEI